MVHQVESHVSRISLQPLSQILFPRIPTAWQADFEQFQRLLARRMAVVAASAALVILPTFQLIEFFLYSNGQDIGLRNALWRFPVMLAAIAVLGMRWKVAEIARSSARSHVLHPRCRRQGSKLLRCSPHPSQGSHHAAGQAPINVSEVTRPSTNGCIPPSCACCPHPDHDRPHSRGLGR